MSQNAALDDRPPKREHLAELWLFLGGIALLNLHTFGIQLIEPQIYLPAAIAAGEWWRVLTHPFVHVTWYHLLLDAGGFVFLYLSLERTTRWRRLTCVAACGAGSLFLTLLTTPSIETLGFCGLSGIAHGLMAIVGLDLALGRKAGAPDLRAVGWTYLILVVGKCLWELLTGKLFLAFMHMGMTGTPMVACHLGGVLGGVVMYSFLKRPRVSETGSVYRSKTKILSSPAP